METLDAAMAEVRLPSGLMCIASSRSIISNGFELSKPPFPGYYRREAEAFNISCGAFLLLLLLILALKRNAAVTKNRAALSRALRFSG